ncbi:hypothetical protein BH10PAT3_BH10PAT3_0290 [soil metagenome]
MYISKVLKRKDASSVSIAVVMALAFTNFLASISARPAGLLLGLKDGTYASYNFPGSSFTGIYIYPLVLLLLELLFLEISIRLIVWLRPMVVGKKK